jgi:hypothetical protein
MIPPAVHLLTGVACTIEGLCGARRTCAPRTPATHQPAVAMAMPRTRKSTTTAERMVIKECQTVSPNLQHTHVSALLAVPDKREGSRV